MIVSPKTSQSLEHAVGSSSAVFSATMVAGSYYIFVANVDLWFAQGATPTATAGAGSMFLPAKTIVILDGRNGADVATIQDSTGGKASLVPALLY